MEALMAYSIHPSLHSHNTKQLMKPMLHISHFSPIPNLFLKSKPKFIQPFHHVVVVCNFSVTEAKDEKFDWFSLWYLVMPVCDLDMRVPHAKRVFGLDVVVWWDRNENAWKVFDDTCPHILVLLSEGRIDQGGKLQCVCHGWCFNGSGDR